MLEVNGRAIACLYWAGTGVFLVLSGWGFWQLFCDAGVLLWMLSISLVACGAILVGFGIWKALDKRPVVVVDEKGVLNRTGIPSRMITWNDIEQFRLVTVAGREPSWLAIDLVDPTAFISKAMVGSSGMLKAFQEKYGTPCVIGLIALDIEPHSLLEHCKSAMRQFKR